LTVIIELAARASEGGGGNIDARKNKLQPRGQENTSLYPGRIRPSRLTRPNWSWWLRRRKTKGPGRRYLPIRRHGQLPPKERGGYTTRLRTHDGGGTNDVGRADIHESFCSSHWLTRLPRLAQASARALQHAPSTWLAENRGGRPSMAVRARSRKGSFDKKLNASHRTPRSD